MHRRSAWPPVGGALMLLLCVQSPRAAEERPAEAPAPRPEYVTTLPLAATLSLPARRAASPPFPVVMIAHDRLGPDTRAEPYADQLTAAGIAVLDLLSDDADGGALDRVADALAWDPRIDGGRLGVLGFGAGGLAAAGARTPFLARALLYPGCAAVAGAMLRADPAPWAGSALLLGHGGADTANPRAACEAFADAMQRRDVLVRHIEYGGASYAWDRPAFGVAGRSLLPAPDGNGRVAALPWPSLAALSATQVAGFFTQALRPEPGR